MPANRECDAPRRWTIAAGVLVALIAPTACSAKALDGLPASIAPARPAPSPPLTRAPAGSTRPISGHPQTAVFDSRTGQLVALSSDLASNPTSLVTTSSAPASERVIALPGPATGLTGDDAGTVSVSTRGGYFQVDLASGHVVTRTVRDAEHVDFSAITRRSDATVVLGTADGQLYALAPGSADARRTRVHARVDSLAASGNTVAVLDREQTTVTTVDVDGRVGQSLRAGQGATIMTADPAGRLLVSDTRGGELLVFGLEPLILRQAYPVPYSPYGVAGSRGLAWVSQTSANIVVGYDLSTGIPVEKVRYPSVRQPNALALDQATGTLYVVAGADGLVQVIEHAADSR